MKNDKKWRHTPITRQWKEADDALAASLKDGTYDPLMLLKLRNIANKGMLEFAQMLELLHTKGCTFSHGMGPISDVLHNGKSMHKKPKDES